MAEREPDDDAWIEKVVKVTTALGMNPMRTRWKLIRWQERRRKAARHREQQLEHIRYRHKTCETCGAVQDREATRCSRCEAKLGRRGFQVVRRIGLGVPEALSISTLLALAMIAVYVRVLIAAGGGIGSPAVHLLDDFGGHSSPAVAEEPWRLVTAIFLHAGLWHLGFNLLAIATIGPRIEALHGRLTMLFLFVATGTLANIGSGAVGLDGVGIGASGGMMGLIGVAVGYGQRLGTSAGRALRDDMLKWTAYTLVFGLFIGADNWAHVFGGLAGAAFGFAVRPEQWNAPRLVPLRAVLGLAGAVAAIGALVIIFTRTPVEADEAVQAERAFYEPFARMCRQLFDGDAAGARKAFDGLTKDLALSAYVPDESADGGTWQRAQDPAALYGDDPVGFTCENLLVTREWCRRGTFDSTGIQPADPKLCADVERAFGAFPERPRRPLPPVEAGDAGALP